MAKDTADAKGGPLMKLRRYLPKISLPVNDRFSAEPSTGCVALKSVSVAYLTHSGGAEFN
jgi:hypothetical protein